MRRVVLGLALAVCAWGLWLARSWWPALVSLLGAGAGWLAVAEIAAPLVCIGAARAFAREERQPGPAALLRVLLVGCGLSWTCFLLSVPIYRDLWLELALGPALGIAALVLWLELRTVRWKPVRAKLARALLATLALSPPLCEAALRVLARVRPSQLLAREESAPERVLNSRRLAHVPSVLFDKRRNAGGFFDEEFTTRSAGEQRVTLIGDSFCQDIVPFEMHFSTIAERTLGLPVDNMGISGIGPFEYEELLVREALPLDPSAVVLAFFVGNDFELSPEGPESEAWPAGWLDRSKLLVCLVPERLASMQGERRANPTGIAGEQSARAVKDSALPLEERYPWLLHPELEPERITRQRFLWIERSRATFVCTAKERELLRAVRVLERMRVECDGRPFGVLLIPDEFQVEDGLWAELALEGMERDRPQKLLLRQLGEHGIPVLDLLPVMRAVEPLADGKRHLYHLTDTHWNARGNAVAGEALARFVRALLAREAGGGR